MASFIDKSENQDDKSYWAIGGSIMIGIGVGFFFLLTNPMFFVACIMIGIGVGLVLEAFLGRGKE